MHDVLHSISGVIMHNHGLENVMIFHGVAEVVDVLDELASLFFILSDISPFCDINILGC